MERKKERAARVLNAKTDHLSVLLVLYSLLCDVNLYLFSNENDIQNMTLYDIQSIQIKKYLLTSYQTCLKFLLLF